MHIFGKNDETINKARGSMIKKIEILGMRVDNYTVREAILQLDTYMNTTVLNVIETVTMKQLMMAGENPAVRECIEQADLSLIGDREILAEMGCSSVQRMREVRDGDFMREVLRRIVRNRKRVFFIAMTRADVNRMQEFVTETNPGLSEAGSFAVEECVGDLDYAVNEINGATPDIVISGMTSPFEEEFVLGHKDKIGASVWYGAGDVFHKKPGILKTDSLKNLMLRFRLHHTVSRYQNENKDRN